MKSCDRGRISSRSGRGGIGRERGGRGRGGINKENVLVLEPLFDKFSITIFAIKQSRDYD